MSDFRSEHDLVVHESEPHVGLSVLRAQNLEPALDSVSPSLSAPLSKINIKKKKVVQIGYMDHEYILSVRMLSK